MCKSDQGGPSSTIAKYFYERQIMPLIIWSYYKGLIDSIYKQPIQLNIKKQTTKIKIRAEEFNRLFFFQGRHEDRQEVHEKNAQCH